MCIGFDIKLVINIVKVNLYVWDHLEFDTSVTILLLKEILIS